MSPLSSNKNLRIIFSVTLMAVMGVASITPAFPRMQQALGVTTEQVGLLITLFTFPGIILAPVLGVMADRYGRKRILVPSLLLFGIAGPLCGVIHDFQWLLLMRMVQGIGGAALGSLNVTLIGDLYKGKERATAMGYNASVLSVGTASYPAIGGGLAMIGWYAPFFLPLLAIPVGILVLFALTNPEPESPVNLGSYLRDTIKNLANREVAGLLFASITTFILIYGAYLTFFPFLVHDRFGSPPYIIGLLMSSMSFTTAVTSSQLGRLSQRYAEARLLRVAFVLYVVSLVLFPFASHIWFLFLPLILFGAAQGLNIPGIQTLLAGLAPMQYRGAFMSLNGMALRTGQTIGPVVMGLAFAAAGMRGVYWAGAVVAAVTLLALSLLVRPPSRPGRYSRRGKENR